MVVCLVLVEGDKVIEENLMIPLTNAEEFLIGRVDGLGILAHFVAPSTTDLDTAVRGLTEVPNVTGVLTLATKHTA